MATSDSTCKVAGCDHTPRGRGMCSKHYQRFRRKGTTEPRYRETVEERFWEKVRKTETCWEWTAGLHKSGYGKFSTGGSRRAHRFSYELVHGPIPDGVLIDHTCHNFICVNPAHLRPVNNSQNGQNRRGPNSNNASSGVRGVYRERNRWCAALTINGKRVYFGRFDTIAEAEAAVVEARRQVFTHSQEDPS